MILRILFLLAILATFISCNKNNDLPNLIGEYKTDTIASLTPVRMFTANGEVTDMEIIREYLEKKGANRFNFNRISSLTPDFMTLTFIENKEVIVKTPFSNTVKSELIKRTATELLIAYPDSMLVYTSGGLIPKTHSRCDTLSRALQNIDPPRVYYRFSAAVGIGDFYTFRPIFQVRIKNNRLFLPLISYVVNSEPKTPVSYYYCRQTSMDNHNSFNVNVIGQLQTGDTIVYQEKEVAFIKQ